jgi:purine-binding chemotaxis protein CheW
MQGITNREQNQYAIFRLGDVEYGLDIQKITIIEKILTITRVPGTPDYIKGVINLRGEIIPIIDLGKVFNLSTVEDTEDTRVIILSVDDSIFGVRVDAVVEVIPLLEDSIESVSDFSSDLSMEYIMGVGKVENRIITLLDFEKLIMLALKNE